MLLITACTSIPNTNFSDASLSRKISSTSLPRVEGAKKLVFFPVGRSSVDSGTGIGRWDPVALTYEKSIEYCTSIGARLPTAREVAERIIGERGAICMLETEFPKVPSSDSRVQQEIKKNSEYWPVFIGGYGPDGTVDFYYTNKSNCKFWLNELQGREMWTSTPDAKNSVYYYFVRFLSASTIRDRNFLACVKEATP